MLVHSAVVQSNLVIAESKPASVRICFVYKMDIAQFSILGNYRSLREVGLLFKD